MQEQLLRGGRKSMLMSSEASAGTVPKEAAVMQGAPQQEAG